MTIGLEKKNRFFRNTGEGREGGTGTKGRNRLKNECKKDLFSTGV
jgi:hypothetical protein